MLHFVCERVLCDRVVRVHVHLKCAVTKLCVILLMLCDICAKVFVVQNSTNSVSTLRGSYSKCQKPGLDQGTLSGPFLT